MKQYVAILYKIKTYDTLLQWKIKHTNRYIVMNIKIVYTQLKKPNMTNERQKKKEKKMGLLSIIKHAMRFIYTKRHFIITFIILTTFQAIKT